MTVAFEDLWGRLVDCDTHLYVPPSHFVSAFGEGFVPRFRAIHERLHGKRDVAEYGQGVVRQLMFPDGMVSTVLTSRMPGAWEAAKRYNDFAQEWAGASHGRLRPA